MNDERVKKLEKALPEILEPMFAKNVRITMELFEANYDELLQGFCSALQAGAKKASEAQRQGIKEPVVYVMASYLLSDALLNTNRLRIDFFDARFYADLTDIHSYWDYSLLFPYIEDDEQALRKFLLQSLPRFVEYEVRDVMTQYRVGVVMLLRECLKKIAGQKQVWQALTPVIAAECSLTYGAYYDQYEQLTLLKKEQAWSII